MSAVKVKDFCCDCFPETKPHGDVLSEEKITIVPIAEVKGVRGTFTSALKKQRNRMWFFYRLFFKESVSCFAVGPKVVTYVTKVMVQSLQLLRVLLTMELQEHVLMQVCYLCDSQRGNNNSRTDINFVTLVHLFFFFICLN